MDLHRLMIRTGGPSHRSVLALSPCIVALDPATLKCAAAALFPILPEVQGSTYREVPLVTGPC
eukprot:8773642-Pyramimonas_sp.AAC.1